MRKMIFSLIAALLLAAPVSAQDEAAQPAAVSQLPPDDENAVVSYGGPVPLSIRTDDGARTFNVEIADNPRARARGMMFRDSMGEDDGMIFLYDAPRVLSIWMKNTEIPLDILYIGGDGEILKIVHGARPFSLQSLSSEVPAMAVLELKGGRTAALNIAPGDVVEYPAFGTAQTPDAANDNDESDTDADVEMDEESDTAAQ